MASTFCVRPHSSTTKGGARFVVGWAPHIRGCPGICWLSTDRRWVLTALGGVSRLFSFLDLGGWSTMVGVMRKGVCDV